MELKGKSAIVTGGAMGIGLATTKRLLKAGCKVTIWDLNESAMNSSFKELSVYKDYLFSHKCDVTNKQRVLELVNQALADMETIDILINNAGFVKGGNFLDQPVEVWAKTVDINLNAILYTINAVLPIMNEKNSGHIVNISSAAGMIGVSGVSVYAATKWAVWGLTESLRFESWLNGKHGVKWTSIHPSYIAQGMFEGAKLNPLGNLFVPLVKNHDVIAKAIVEDGLKKEKYAVRRPITLRLVLILRGLLPDKLFQQVLVLMGVHRSMHAFKGRE
jgi:all-trans-retinol dehydrogenase (NAD+)